MQIRKTLFDNFEAVEIKTSKTRMIVVTGVGPRVAHLSAIRGKHETRNLMFWDSPRKYRRKDWLLMGGHRIWGTRPLGDEGEEAYTADNEPCKVRMGSRGITVVGPEMAAYGVRKSLSIKMFDDATFEVESSITNVGDMLWSGGVWSLTATLPKKGCTYGFPLGDDSNWDLFAVVIPKTWGGHTTLVNDPQFSFTEHCLVFTPGGREAKRMVQAPKGLMGMTDPTEKVSFLKHSPYVLDGRYPSNCNLALYNGPGNFMTEMESMGSEVMLKPGQTARNTETWALRDPVDWKKAKEFGI
ncbi:MAG TPA: hypothetical protein DCQ83_06445 [Fibrobacteres bacterium]|nr:hypothetical protein [Fibrobacterota bacterium]